MVLRLSAEHGVNPSIEKCFFCGKDKGIILFGSSYNRGQKAPHCVVINHDPCDACKNLFDQDMVLIIEVLDSSKQGDENPYRTGRTINIHRSKLNEFGAKNYMAFMPVKDFEKAFGDIFKQAPGEEGTWVVSTEPNDKESKTSGTKRKRTGKSKNPDP